MVTLILITLMLVMLVATLSAQAAAVNVVGGLMGVPSMNFRRASIYLIACFVLNVGLLLLRYLLPPSIPLDIMLILVIATAGVALVSKWFKLPPLKSIAFMLATQVCVALISTILAYPIRTFVFEAFKAPTNSMAPTLVGKHIVGTCPRCQHIAIGLPPDSLLEFGSTELPAICSYDYRSCKIPSNGSVGAQDRFLVSKFLEPRRWDMILFQYPEDPSTLYVKRLVGLPGEQVVIKDGAAWANGVKLTPPEEFANLTYVIEFPSDPFPEWILWGDERKPAKLSEGEYFVLGDHSERSKDSRLWVQGADGHPPYAVPKEYIHGVVTTIYWPPSRWRAFK